MTVSANTNVIDDPLTVLAYAETQAAELRKKFGMLTMQEKVNPQDESIMSEPIWATYLALCTSTYLPEFVRLQTRYALERIELSWILGFRLRTPGQLYDKLPLNESLIFPLDKLPDLRASIILKVLH